VTREKRIQYARELLEKNFLPHVSISPGCQTAKVPSLLLIVGIDALYRHLNARPSFHLTNTNSQALLFNHRIECSRVDCYSSLSICTRSTCTSRNALGTHASGTPFADRDCAGQAFFLGYMVNRLLLVALGRREEDDRDHYANKRLDLGGPLLAQLFRQLFRKLTKDVKSYVQVPDTRTSTNIMRIHASRSASQSRNSRVLCRRVSTACTCAETCQRACCSECALVEMLDLVLRSVAAARVGSCKPSADLCNFVVCLMPRFILCRMQKCVDKGKEINIQGAVSKDTITRGLRYAVATGNWGQQGTADLRAGVSQVPTMLACPVCNWLRTRNILYVLPQKTRVFCPRAAPPSHRM